MSTPVSYITANGALDAAHAIQVQVSSTGYDVQVQFSEVSDFATVLSNATITNAAVQIHSVATPNSTVTKIYWRARYAPTGTSSWSAWIEIVQTPSLSNATSSGNYGGYPAAYAIDGYTGTFWHMSGAAMPQWIAFDTTVIIPTTLTIIPRVDYPANARSMNSFVLDGSNDAVTWTTIATFSGITDWAAGVAKTFSLTNTNAYTHLRVTCTATNGDNYAALAEISLTGSAPSGPVYPYVCPPPPLINAIKSLGPQAAWYPTKTTLVDFSGNERHGTISGVEIKDPLIETDFASMIMSGGGYAFVNYGSWMNQPGTSFTILGVVQDLIAGQWIDRDQSNGSAARGWQIQTATGLLNFIITNPTIDNAIMAMTGTTADGVPHLFALSVVGPKHTLLIDGVLVSTWDSANTISDTISSNFAIGASYAGRDSLGQYATGKFGTHAYFAPAISDSDVATIASAGGFTTARSKLNHFPYSSIANVSYSGASQVGTSGSLSTDPTAPSGDPTVLQLTGAANDSYWQLTSFSVSAGTTITLSVHGKTAALDASTQTARLGRVVLFVQTRDGAYHEYATDPVTPDGNWHRVSVTFTVPTTQSPSAALLRFYSNGSPGTPIYWDGLQVECSPVMTPYFDGNTADDTDWDYAWIGAINASPSRALSIGAPTLPTSTQLFIGSGQVSSVNIGTLPVSKIYLGTDQIFPGASPVASLRSLILNKSPIVYYEFAEEIAGATDSISGETLFYRPGVTLSQPGIDSGYAVSGSGTVEVASAAFCPPALSAGTVSAEAWVYLPSTATLGGFFLLGSGTDGWGVGIGSNNWNGAGRNLILLEGNKQWIVTSYVFPAIAGWYHIVATQDASLDLTVYVNGTSIATAAIDPYTPTALIVGNLNLAPDIKIDRLLFYSRILSGARVSAHYNSGTPTDSSITADSPLLWYKLDETTASASLPTTAADSSGNNRSLTYVNYVTIPLALSRPSLKSDGTGHSIDFNGKAYGSIASAAWMNVSYTSLFCVATITTKQLSGQHFILTRWTSGGNRTILFYLDGGKLSFSIYDATGSAQRTVVGQTTLSIGIHTLGASFDGTDLKVYCDGVLDGTFIISTSTIFQGAGANVEIMRAAASDSTLSSLRFSDLAWFDTALRAADFSAFHSATVSP